MDSEMHSKREGMLSSLLPLERKSEEGYNQQGKASILGRTNDQASATHITDRAGPSPLGAVPGLRSSRIDLSPNSRPLLSQFRLADHMPIRSLPRSVTSMSDLKYTLQNGTNPENIGSSTHSLNRGLSLTSYSQMDRKFDSHAHQQTRTQSLLDLHKPLSPLDTRTAMGSRVSLKSFNSQSPDATFPQQFNHSYNKGITSPSGNQADKSPPYNVFSYQSRNANIPAKLGGEDGSRTVIVKSTLCYNTSTQTDMPYNDSVTDTSIDTPRMRHADKQVTEVASPGLSKKLELFGRICEEKSVQTTLNRDLMNQSLDLKAGSYLYNNSRRHSEVLPLSNGIMQYGMSSKTTDRKETDLSSYTSDRIGNYIRQFSYENNTPLEGSKKYQTRYASHEMLNGDVLSRHPPDSTFFNTAAALHNPVNDGYIHKHGLISEVNSATAKSCDPSTSGNLLASSGKRYTDSGIDSNNNVCFHQKSPSDLSNFSDYGSTFGSSTSRHIPSTFPNSAELGSSAGSYGYSRYIPEPFSNKSWSSSLTINDNFEGLKEPANSTSSMMTDPDMKVHNLSLTSGVGSEVSSMYSYQLSPPLESLHDTSFTKTQQSYPHATNHLSPSPAASTFQWKKIVILNPDHIKRSRRDSDSVFIDEDEIEPKYLMYKDFRQKTFTAEASSPNKPTRHTFLSDGLHQLTSTTDDPFKPCDKIVSDQSVPPSPISRVHRISESLSLGNIQEEVEILNSAADKNASFTFSRSGNRYNSNERSITNRIENCETELQFVMRDNAAIPSSNINQRRSETFVDTVASGNIRRSSLDSAAFQRNSYQGGGNSSTLSAFSNYKRSEHSTPAYSLASSQNLVVVRGESDLQITQQRLQQLQINKEHGLKSTSNDLTALQSGKQQMPVKYYDEESSFSNSTLHDISSLDNSFASVRNQSLTETVAELIFKVSENLTKSAQRMGHIRRTSSSSSRSSLDFTDTTRPERTSRRETDWSRIRSLGSLRCSPETDRWLYWSSFASDYLNEDTGILTSSTPRSSFALSRDKEKMLENNSHDASMDSGLVVSPIYQNFPTQRRPPPPPRPAPSSETEPPPLPPRMNREKQPSVSGTKAALDQESPPYPVSTKEKHRIEVIPLGKQQDDDVRVDTSKMNFKDLMMQWKNNSPRETTSPSDLRRQEQKTAEKHSPTSRLVSCVPTTLERTKPTISVASTYRHEPAQKLEATSPVFSPVSSLPSPSKSAFTTSPSVPYVVSACAQSSPLHQPLGVQPSVFTNSSAVYTGLQGSSPSSNDALSPNSADYTGRFSNTTQSISGVRMMINQSPQFNTAQTPSFDRISFLAYSRSRSSSDLLSDQLPGSEHAVTTQRPPVKLHRLLRDRSSSDHDILSDKPSHYHHQFRPSQDGTALAITKSQSAEVADESALRSSQAPYADGIKNTFVSSGRLSNSTLALSNGYQTADDNRGFAAESYIGHKNKSTRSVGTYNRSISAAGLLSTANSTQGKPAGGSDSTQFRNSKLEQQSWNSESLLSSTGNGVKTFPEMGSQVGKAPKDGVQATVTPVRPPRPNARGRQNAKQGSSTASVSNVSQKPTPVSSVSNVSQKTKQASVSMSALDNLAPAASFSVEQGNVSQRECLHRPGPSTPSSPPYDHSQHDHWSPQQASHSLSTLTTSGPASDRKPVNTPQHSHYSPQHRQLALNNNINSSISRTSLDNGQPQSLFIHDSAAKPLSPCSPKEQVPVNIPARDYQRQAIDTASAMLSSTSLENTPTSPLENSASSPHPSDLNMNSPREYKRKSSSTPTLNHLRQPSQEEIECDEKVMELAEELDESDQKLLEVLSQDRAMKRMLYMDGLFLHVANDREKSSPKHTSSSSMRNQTLDRVGGESYDSPGSFKSYSLPRDYQQTPPSRTTLSTVVLYGSSDKSPDTPTGIHENTTVMKHKEELVEKLQKKIQVLKDEKLSLQQQIADNILLGQQVCQVADSRCLTQGEKDKFMTFIDDLEKIVRLLLNLSGQLARAENAVQTLGPETDSKLKKLTWDKREKLHAKHEEAKMLKEAVDRRSEQLLCLLQERLSPQELSDYKQFISMKSRLTIEMQEVDDHLALAEQQIVAVKRSLPAAGASTPVKYFESS